MTDPARVLIAARVTSVDHPIRTAYAEEAVGLRNHIPQQRDTAPAARGPALREAVPTPVFTGGGHAGAQAPAGRGDMARRTTRSRTGVRPADLRRIPAEGAGRRGGPAPGHRHRHAGSAASPGRHRGIASVYGRRPKGYPAWLVHRPYRPGELLSADRKARGPAGRTLAGPFQRETVALGPVGRPRAARELATRPGHGPDGD
ncbi:hypothetical protein [Streptomyces sp. MAR4 CNX-425]|uniref:hypothetical protein n=1 Tax=Streptomyces sp. MAR4 CNX-425 TaxID=3406343 RepID=UPI003B50CDB7